MFSPVDRLLTWADDIDTTRPRPSQFCHSFIRICLIATKEFHRNKLSLRSAALTYTLLLSLVPMLALSTALVKGLGGSIQLREVVYTYIDTLEKDQPGQTSTEQLPLTKRPEDPIRDKETSGGNLTEHLRSAIDKLFAYVDRTNFAALGTISVLAMFLTVILVLNNIEMAMNTIWKVAAGRSLLRKISDYLTLLILMPISINLAFAANTLLHSPKLLLQLERVFPLDWLRTLTLTFLPVFFITLTLSVIYIFFPNTKVKTIPAIIGAIVASLLWFITQNIYISLQVGVSKYNAIYGSFATFPLFLVWIYLGWNFVLAGAEIAFACQKRNAYILHPSAVSPAQSLSAALDIVHTVYLNFQRRQKLNMSAVIDSCSSYPPQLLKKLTDELVHEGILAKSGDNTFLLPTAPARETLQENIVQLILGKTEIDSPGGRASKKVIAAAGKSLGSSFDDKDIPDAS